MVAAGLLVLPLTAQKARAQSGGPTVYGTPLWQSGYGGNDTIYETEAIIEAGALEGPTLAQFAQSSYVLQSMNSSTKANFSAVDTSTGYEIANGTLGGVMSTGTSKFYEFYDGTHGYLVVTLPTALDLGVVADVNFTAPEYPVTLTTSLNDSAATYALQFSRDVNNGPNATGINVTGAYNVQWNPSIAALILGAISLGLA